MCSSLLQYVESVVECESPHSLYSKCTPSKTSVIQFYGIFFRVWAFSTNVFYSHIMVHHKGLDHRRKINIEEKANVVAAIRGTELIQFLAALAVFPYNDFEKF